MALPNTNPTIQYLDAMFFDGTVLGQTTGALVAFYNATPTTRPTSANQAAVATTVPSSTQVAFTLTSAQQAGIITLLNQIRSDLVTLGLIKGS